MIKLVSTRIVTDNVPTLAKFYEAITQLQSVGCSDHYVEIETSVGILAICSCESVKHFNFGAAVARANRSMIIEFQVDDVDQERTRVAGLVPSFVMEPTDQPWGTRSMLFRDPDGNLINMFAILSHRPMLSGNCGLSDEP
jgi:hypothetical protein